MKEICGDLRLNRKQKIVYFFTNLTRCFIGYWSRLKTKHLPSKIDEKVFNTTDSPARYLLDRAFKQVLLEQHLPKRLAVLDIGCGSAYLRQRLVEMGFSGNYTGVDVMRAEKYLDDNKHFASKLVIGAIEEVNIHDTFDLVMSVTALEHIRDDFKAVAVASSVVKPGGVQMHIVPMGPSLFLYLWHGYRQYTPDRLKRMFGSTDVVIYRIGGIGSFLAHLLWITIPERMLGIKSLRTRHTKSYSAALRTGFWLDNWLPFGTCMWAVVVRQ